MRNRAIATVLLAVALAACPRRPPEEPTQAVDLLVIAPHPDDEVLMAGGVLEAAVKAGRRAAVIVVTNGDFGCFDDRDGAVRQAESIAALTALGLAEDDVHFLGYPDGHLSQLSEAPLPPVAWRAPDGTCRTRASTLATRGEGRRDEHARRTGRDAPFTAAALTEDLAALLQRLSPRDIYLPHSIDEHPDHAATYAFFRRALARLERGPVTVHRAVVHAGRCWPTDCATPFAPDADEPPLPAPHDGYAPTERVPVDALRKFDAIARYASQAGPQPRQDWLAGFARRTEAFFTQPLARAPGGGWARADAARSMEQPIANGGRVRLVSGEEVELTISRERATLHDGERVLSSWSLVAASPPFVLRVEAADAEAGYADWCLWGAGQFAGAGVVRDFPAR